MSILGLLLSFYNVTKVEMGKDVYSKMWWTFNIWSGKLFANLIGQFRLKLIYRLVDYELLGPKFQDHKLVWIKLPHPNSKEFSTSNVKKNSNLQMDIFCNFDFCHSRRNGLNLKFTPLLLQTKAQSFAEQLQSSKDGRSCNYLKNTALIGLCRH